MQMKGKIDNGRKEKGDMERLAGWQENKEAKLFSLCEVVPPPPPSLYIPPLAISYPYSLAALNVFLFSATHLWSFYQRTSSRFVGT